MAERSKRSTVYFEPRLHEALRVKAAHSGRSVSDLVNEALRTAFAEDREDLAAFDDRAGEPTMSYEDLLRALEADGTL
ncbi:MAG: hypothetical protein U5K81_10165 [Trueperaceae bacterium]|nr:hypothetical protein [Trueperaceae bacterium]